MKESKRADESRESNKRHPQYNFAKNIYKGLDLIRYNIYFLIIIWFFDYMFELWSIFNF